MEALLAIIKDGKVEILGKEYTITKIGKYVISLKGRRGGRYSITDCPKCKVIENKSLPVFALVHMRSLKSTDFAISNSETVSLVRLS